MFAADMMSLLHTNRSRRSLLILSILSLIGIGSSWTPPSNSRRRPRRLFASSSTSTVSEQRRVPATTRNLETPSILADDDDFVKPERDKRAYRAVRLRNNLEVLLVSTNTSEGTVGIEAASVHVQAGHFDDTLPGLAHFHEHMLFLGTAKYPSEDEYENYLNQFGGYSNAYTDMEDTNYYFSVTTTAGDKERTSEALHGALDRLSQFFIAPTFDRDAVDRELKAIDSEYVMSKTSDSWRNFQFLKSTCNPSHPFSKFGCGNYKTLTEKGLDHLLLELQRFWRDYYQTYNLRLTVVGHASLDALQSTVVETFGQLPISQGDHRRLYRKKGQVFERENAVYNAPAFTTKQLCRLYEVIPYTESRSIKLLFAVPPVGDPNLRDSKPYRVLSHLIGHESAGSLHAVLSEDGYLADLSSGVSIDTSDFGLFSVTLSLTPKGMKERDHVLDLTFQWIALICNRRDELPLYHDELRKIAETNFRFRENGDAVDFASAASELLFDEDIDHGMLLRSSSIMKQLDMKFMDAFVARLNPRNCMVMATSSDFVDDDEWQSEPWYGARFKQFEIEPERYNTWCSGVPDSRLRLPGHNKFIPTDFSIKGKVTQQNQHTYPTLLVDTQKLRLWHKLDNRWLVPKAFVRLSLVSPTTYASPRSMTLNRLFQQVLDDDLNSHVYDASLAGCTYHILCTPSGYRISIGGYSETVPVLLRTLITRIRTLISEMKNDDSRLSRLFDTAKEKLLKETKNYRLDSPTEVNNYNSRLLMEEKVWFLDDYIDELESQEPFSNPLTLQECASCAEQSFAGRIKCEALVMGNLNETESQESVRKTLEDYIVRDASTLKEAEIPSFRSHRLPTKSEAAVIFGRRARYPVVFQEIAFSETEENNAIEVTLQFGSELELGYEGMALLDLLAHIAYNSAFAQLRTKEQLGYSVSVHARKTAGSAWSLCIVVQGDAVLPEQMEQRIEEWIMQFRSELERMEVAAVAQEASAVVSQLLEDNSKMSLEVGQCWGAILSTERLPKRMKSPVFDRLKRLASSITVGNSDSRGDVISGESLKAKLLQLVNRSMAASSSDRRALCTHFYSQNNKAAYESALGMPGVLSSYADMREMKQHLSTMPNVPYVALNSE